MRSINPSNSNNRKRKKKGKKAKSDSENLPRREFNATQPSIGSGGAKRSDARKVYSEFLQWIYDLLQNF